MSGPVVAGSVPRLVLGAVVSLGGCVADGRGTVAPATASYRASGPLPSCEGARTLQRDLSYGRAFDPDTQIYVTEAGELCRFDGR